MAGGGGQGPRIAQVADRPSSTLDAAFASVLGAVIVVGRDPDQSGGRLVADAAKLGRLEYLIA
jgi:hypothetical protein